jgi:hypothetical protein
MLKNCPMESLDDKARQVLWRGSNDLGSRQTASLYPSNAKQRDSLSLSAYLDFTSRLQNFTIQCVLKVNCIALDKPCEKGYDLGSCQTASMYPPDAKQRDLLSLLAYTDCASRLQNCIIQGVAQVA